jgi:hypothetical protein
MKTKILTYLLACHLILLAAWLVHGQRQGQTNDVPEKYRDMVRKGLDYLAKQQRVDGHWEGDGGQHPVAVTALAGMALLMDGGRNNPKAKYDAQVRKAVDWLIARSQTGREGLIYSEHPSETSRYMEGHGLATQFLAWVHRGDGEQDRRNRHDKILQSAAAYILKAQSTRGGWYHTSRVEGHDLDLVSVTAIQIQALYLLRDAGLPLRSDAAAADAQEYVKTTLAKYEKDAKKGLDRKRTADTAVALACRCVPVAFLNQDSLSTQWFQYCRPALPAADGMQSGLDELAHYYYAQALFNLHINPEHNARTDAVAWPDYRKGLFDHLQSTQKADGSWPVPAQPEGGWSVGPVYSTALRCIILQYDKRTHPLTIHQVMYTF